VKAELREMTKRPVSLESLEVRSSVMPSLKYSCLRVATQVDERQHDQRGPLGLHQRRGLRGRSYTSRSGRAHGLLPNDHPSTQEEQQPYQHQGPLPPRQSQDAVYYTPVPGQGTSCLSTSPLCLLVHRRDSRPGFQLYPIHPHRLGDVLDGLRP